MIKYRCDCCAEISSHDEIEANKDMLNNEYTIDKCPKCNSEECLRTMCYVSDCNHIASSGFIKNGEYVFACSHHYKVRNDT